MEPGAAVLTAGKDPVLAIFARQGVRAWAPGGSAPWRAAATASSGRRGKVGFLILDKAAALGSI